MQELQGPEGLSRTVRRQRVLLAVAAVATLVSVGGLAASSLIRSPAERVAQTAPPPNTVLTAAATMQVLTPSVVVRGTVYPPTQYNVTATPASAEVTQLYVSALNVQVGDEVAPGRLLAEVSGQPLFALSGAVPAYRDLKPGATGPDVTELQDALVALGLSVHSDEKGAFGTGTAQAVSDFYGRLGQPVPTTGAATQQAVDTAKKAVDTAQQSVDALTAQKKAAAEAPTTPAPGTAPTAGPTAGAGTGTATGGTGGLGIDQQLTSARKELSAAKTALAKAAALNGPMVPAAHVVFLPVFPATVTAVNGAVGAPASGPLLTLTSGGLSLTAQPTQAQAAAVRAGMAVQIFSETSNTTLTGTVAALGTPTTVAPAGRVIPIGGAAGSTPAGAGGSGSGGGQGLGQGGASGPGAGQGGALYVPLAITPATPLPAAMNGQNVRIAVLTGSSTTPVLSVPVAAVFTTSAGRTSVTKADAAGQRSTVAVTTGATDRGLVAVTPDDAGALKAGDQVVVGK
ncbi:peptidoglycan-binding protein [Kitasatospora sp. NPDC057223]|uniref:peptidoglycan-binding protein n=1 Tax=Kitasatospora sp. NPDC057223 TaxID=3346055 RepID=UPI003640B75E